jgi:hypothetical protein
VQPQRRDSPCATATSKAHKTALSMPPHRAKLAIPKRQREISGLGATPAVFRSKNCDFVLIPVSDLCGLVPSADPRRIVGQRSRAFLLAIVVPLRIECPRRCGGPCRNACQRRSAYRRRSLAQCLVVAGDSKIASKRLKFTELHEIRTEFAVCFWLGSYLFAHFTTSFP